MGEASRIRLLIVDDHPVFRDGPAALSDDPLGRRRRRHFQQTIFLGEIIQLTPDVGLFHGSLRSQLGESLFTVAGLRLHWGDGRLS